MSASTSVKVKVKKGLKANVPAFGEDGELLFATDTGELWVGTGAGKVQVQVSANDPLAVLKAGDTMSGSLGIYTAPSYPLDVSGTANVTTLRTPTIKCTQNVVNAIEVVDTSGAVIACFDAFDRYVGIRNSSPLYPLDVTGAIYASGNFTSDSGLYVGATAVSLDGHIHIGFAPAIHWHDSDYVNVSGDTMTGPLTVRSGFNSGGGDALVLSTNDGSGRHELLFTRSGTSSYYIQSVYQGVGYTGLLLNYYGGDVNICGGLVRVDRANSRVGIARLASTYAFEVAGSVMATNNMYCDSTKRVACGGGSTGANTTVAGTVTLEINGQSYYLCRANSA